MEKHLKISEDFYSVQGEGPTTGVPSYFIRLQNCNLTCGTTRAHIGEVKSLGENNVVSGSFKGKLEESGEASWTCFASGHKINTRDGAKKIENINIGDKLLSFNENTKQIEDSRVIKTKTKIVNKSDLLTIKIENGKKFICTKNHPFYIKGKWIKASNLNIGDEMYHIPLKQLHSIVSTYKQKNMSDIARKSKRDKLKKMDKSYMYTEDYKIAHETGQKNIDWEKVSQRMKDNNPMKNPATVRKNWKAHNRRMSGIENKLQKLAERYNLPIKYVGNGKLWINNKNPDFEVIGEKKVIEVYDSAYKPWNDGYVRDKKWEYERGQLFKEKGYECLFIDFHNKNNHNSNWTHQKQQEVRKALQTFCLNGKKIISISPYTGTKREVYTIECDNNKNYFVNNVLVHNCDSIPVWVHGHKKPLQYLIDRWDDSHILDMVLEGKCHLIWTGGEPTLPRNQRSINDFITYLYDWGKMNERGVHAYNEIETNGSLIINDELFNNMHQINCSAKLSNSGMPLDKRVNPEAIEIIKKHPNYNFKFVVSNEKDIIEAYDTYIQPFKIPIENVCMMPGLDNKHDFHKQTNFILEMAKKYGFRGLQRLHISAWGAVTGV